MRRILRVAAIVALALILAATLAAAGYDLATAGDYRDARSLYGGPFVRVDGTLLAYRDWGSRGTPIVLVGGFVEPSWVWSRVGPLLARRHRVYALDLPPFGYSERRGPYTLAHWIELVHGFDRRLGIGRPTLVGHSLGAAVVAGAALAAPAFVRGIVLLDGDALPAGGRPGRLVDLLADPWYPAVFRYATGADWIVRRALRGAYARGSHPDLGAAVLAHWERPFLVRGTPQAFRQMLRYGIPGLTHAELSRVRVPRLVVWGADDTVDPVAAGREAARTLRTRFVLVAGAGHVSMLERPHAVAAAIERGV